MKLLLLGPTGQVGWELQRALAPLGEVLACGSKSGGALRADFTDPEAVAQLVRRERPDAIVNAAAHTAVDRAESEPEVARQVNATTPGVLAREAAACGAWLVHYSTDYVFDGSGAGPRDEDAATGPLNVYGRTKLEGEDLIRASGCRHLILRTSWVHAARGGNFARTMLRLASEREALNVIDDQIGAPTGADLLADVTAAARRLAGRHLPLHGRRRNQLARLRTLRHRLGARPRATREGGVRGTAAHRQRRLPHTGTPAAEFAPRLPPAAGGVRAAIAAVAAWRDANAA
jgi:dTDP-4-dehydrorhamnose reductase